MVPILVALGAQLIEAVIPLASPTLQLLSTANKVWEKAKSGNVQMQKRQEETSIRH
jgi:hypothetical protein